MGTNLRLAGLVALDKADLHPLQAIQQNGWLFSGAIEREATRRRVVLLCVRTMHAMRAHAVIDNVSRET